MNDEFEIPQEYEIPEESVEEVTTVTEVENDITSFFDIPKNSFETNQSIFDSSFTSSTDFVSPLAGNLPSSSFDFNTLVLTCVFIVVCLCYFRRRS